MRPYPSLSQRIMKSISKCLVFLVIASILLPVVALAADGDVVRNSPSAATVAITEPADQAFSVTITNSDPTNLSYIITWYQNGTIVQTDPATNLTTSATFTFVGGADTAGVYNITAISNTTNQTSWTLTITDFMFAGVQDVLEETISTFTYIVNLVVGIVPVLVVMAVVGLVFGIFTAIATTLKRGF